MDLKELSRDKYEHGRLPLFNNKSRGARSCGVYASIGSAEHFAPVPGTAGLALPTRESQRQPHYFYGGAHASAEQPEASSASQRSTAAEEVAAEVAASSRGSERRRERLVAEARRKKAEEEAEAAQEKQEKQEHGGKAARRHARAGNRGPGDSEDHATLLGADSHDSHDDHDDKDASNPATEDSLFFAKAIQASDNWYGKDKARGQQHRARREVRRRERKELRQSVMV